MFESTLKWLLILWGAFFAFGVVQVRADFKNETPIARIKNLYVGESARIGKKDPNPALTKSRLEEAAKGITNEEIDWLAAQALNTKEVSDFRVFAVYLLALHSSDLSTEKLRNIALSEMPKKNLVEREVREQAIKGLGKSKNPHASEALLVTSTDQKDLALQDKAHQALYEFETGRPAPTPVQKSKKK